MTGGGDHIGGVRATYVKEGGQFELRYSLTRHQSVSPAPGRRRCSSREAEAGIRPRSDGARRSVRNGLLTVSSQLKNPMSVGGRILDVFMEIYAISVIGALAGALGSFLQKRGQEIDAKR